MKATVRLDPRRHVGPLDPRVFGGFLEHLGRAIYGGVYDPGNSRSDERGFRTDVVDAMRRMRMPVVRYPGGNFVSNYEWKDGIGPKERRPRRADFAWQTVEPNTFGTDEFIDWCRAIGAAPMLAVNLGTGTPKSAAELVEYCNLPGGTSWAELRAENGHEEPHAVPLWCLGNEMDGPWQAGHVPAREYAYRARQAGALMKGIDPSIELVLAGSSGRQMPTYLEWEREALEYTWDLVDYVSPHRYSRNENDDSPWFLAEGVEIDRILDDYRGVLAYVRGVKRSDKRVYLSFDEWNVWYRSRGHRRGGWREAPDLLDEVYNLEDAVVCAQYLNSFIRNADIVKIACLAQIVNVIAPVVTRADGLLLQTTFWPFVEYAAHARGLALTPLVESPAYTADDRVDVPVLDVASTLDPADGRLCVFAVNRSLEEPLEVTVKPSGVSVESVVGTSVVTGSGPKVENTWDQPDAVRPMALEAKLATNGDVTLTVPPLSSTVLRVRLRA